MKLNMNIESIILDTISLFFVLLLVYAAVSKFLDFENFQGLSWLSSLLSAFTDYASVGVITLKILIIEFYKTKNQ